MGSLQAVDLSAVLAAEGYVVPIEAAERALRAIERRTAGPSGGLTPRQRDAMLAIQAAVDREGVTPSRRELMRALGLASISQAAELVVRLEERGWLRRLPGRARGLEILRRVR